MSGVTLRRALAPMRRAARTRGVCVLALVLSAAAFACTIQETGRADSMTADTGRVGDRRRAEEVRTAVAVARALRAAPERADSVLRAHDLTRGALDSLLYRIAADAALAVSYDRGIATAGIDELD